MIVIENGRLTIKGSMFEIGAEVTELIVTLKRHHSDILETAILTADELIASGVKLTTHEEMRRFEVEEEN